MNKPKKEIHRNKYFCKGLTPEMIKRAEEELGETEEIRIQSLKEIKELIRKEPDFYPCMDDSFLLRYLRARKFNVDKAFKTLKNYYMYKARYSGILTDFKPSDFKEPLEEGKGFALIYRDVNDVGIGVIRVGAVDIDLYTPEEMLGCALVCTEVGLTPEATQVVGYSMIFDFEGFDLRMAKHYASPTFLYKLVTIIQDCIPCRIQAYHIINEPIYVNIIFSILRSFLSKKINNRIHFHGTNLKSLHKHISPEVLPEELGGKSGPTSKHVKEYVETIFRHEEHVDRMNKFGYQGKTLEEIRKASSITILS